MDFCGKDPPMTHLAYKFAVAPMMDWTERFLISMSY